MLQISHLKFQYPNGEFCLDLPDLAVETGAKVAVIGPSGCGKTTLLHLIAGIQVPITGSIQVDDTFVPRLQEAERRRFRITRIGFIFQDFELLDYLNVMDNILHPYRLNPALMLTAEVRQNAIALAQQVGVQDKLQRRINHLSQGERQRVAICRALLPQPQLLLADEATGNLDPANKQRVLDILFDYVDRQPATLLAVTHDRELLNRFDRVIDFKSFLPLSPNPVP